MKRYTIREVCRAAEWAPGEYEIGDYLYDLTTWETALWYEEHNYDFTPEEVKAQ